MNDGRLDRYAVLLALLLTANSTRAAESSDSILLARGRVQGGIAGRVSASDGNAKFSLDGFLRVGIGARLEIAAPLAVQVLLVDGGALGGIVLGLGVPDACISSERRLLFSPVAAIAGRVHIGHESALLGALDVTGAEEGLQRGRHSAWLRGGLGLMIDFGSYATLGFGVAHQREVASGEHPEGLYETGWAGDFRVSFGAVRAMPFSDLPTLSIHLQEYLDLITSVRFDIDLDTNLFGTRMIVGVELRR